MSCSREEALRRRCSELYLMSDCSAEAAWVQGAAVRPGGSIRLPVGVSGRRLPRGVCTGPMAVVIRGGSRCGVSAPALVAIEIGCLTPSAVAGPAVGGHGWPAVGGCGRPGVRLGCE